MTITLISVPLNNNQLDLRANLEPRRDDVR